MSEIHRTFANYRCPFLAIQGGSDRVVSPMGVFELYEQSPLSEEEKDLIFIEDMWHAIWHDP
jgi:alpha-beta hydrolase superfamily lysophospholipase